MHLEGGIGVQANVMGNDAELKTQLQHAMWNQRV